MSKNMQYFEWGYIEWIYEPDPKSTLNSMSIGITTILPNKRQNKHIHYGDEQFIYVLSGEGIQLIGNKVSEMKPRQIYHMEAGTIHETINNRDVPIKHLLISIPANYEMSVPVRQERLSGPEDEEQLCATIRLNDDIRYIYDTVAGPLNVPVAVFDAEGNVIIQGKDYPHDLHDRMRCLPRKPGMPHVRPEERIQSSSLCKPIGIHMPVRPYCNKHTHRNQRQTARDNNGGTYQDYR